MLAICPEAPPRHAACRAAGGAMQPIIALEGATRPFAVGRGVVEALVDVHLVVHEERTEDVTYAGATVGLRERKKAGSRAEIRETALRLFLAQAYEATMVQQIADAAEVLALHPLPVLPHEGAPRAAVRSRSPSSATRSPRSGPTRRSSPRSTPQSARASTSS